MRWHAPSVGEYMSMKAEAGRRRSRRSTASAASSTTTTVVTPCRGSMYLFWNTYGWMDMRGGRRHGADDVNS